MVGLVRERPAESAPHASGAPVGRLPRDYYRVLVAVGLFGIGNSSNSFLILRTQQLGASVSATVFVYAAFNLVAALASYPTGALSDRLGRKWVLLSSLLVFAGVYLGFGVTSHVAGIGLLFALYGLHQGAFRSVGKALATDFVPEELRATAVGGYSATLGLTGLFASIVGGQLWVRFGPAATFLFGAASALAGAAALLLLVPGTSLRSGRAPRPGAP
jgi:MFS family permease